MNRISERQTHTEKERETHTRTRTKRKGERDSMICISDGNKIGLSGRKKLGSELGNLISFRYMLRSAAVSYSKFILYFCPELPSNISTI